MTGNPRKDYIVGVILDNSMSMSGMGAIGSTQAYLSLASKFFFYIQCTHFITFTLFCFCESFPWEEIFVTCINAPSLLPDEVYPWHFIYTTDVLYQQIFITFIEYFTLSNF